MRITRIMSLLVALGLSVQLPVVAHAQDAGEQAAAQALFDEGLRLFGESKFGEACAKFEASLALLPAMGTRGKLAECYEKVGRTASAWAAYREVAVLAKREGQTRREEVANERAARLEASLSYLTITVPTEARLDGLRIDHNGIVLKPGAYGTAIATDPGPQTIVVSADGYESRTLSVELEDRAKSTVEVPVLVALPEPDPVQPAVGLLGDAPPRPESKVQRNLGIASVAAGGGALALAGVLGLMAKSDYDGAFDDGLCESDNTCTPEGVTIVEDARSLANVGTVFAISGVALVGVGAYLWWRSPGETQTRERAVRISPNAGSDNVGLTLSGWF